MLKIDRSGESVPATCIPRDLSTFGHQFIDMELASSFGSSECRVRFPSRPSSATLARMTEIKWPPFRSAERWRDKMRG